MLASAALTYARITGVDTEIVFDTTHLPKSASESSEFAGIPAVGTPITLENGNTFMVSSARPEFRTTDDKLISWARQQRNDAPSSTASPLSSAGNDNVVVVTSDRALAGELSSLGISLVKPKQWIAMFSSVVFSHKEDIELTPEDTQLIN